MKRSRDTLRNGTLGDKSTVDRSGLKCWVGESLRDNEMATRKVRSSRLDVNHRHQEGQEGQRTGQGTGSSNSGNPERAAL